MELLKVCQVRESGTIMQVLSPNYSHLLHFQYKLPKIRHGEKRFSRDGSEEWIWKVL